MISILYECKSVLFIFNVNLKFPSTQKSVFLLPTVECWSFTVQNNVCAEFDTRRLFSHSSAESGKFLCAH